MIAAAKTYLNRLPFSPAWIGVFFGILSFLLRVPFLFRYDLHFGGDPASGYLMALRIIDGDRPFYFYDQDYMGALEPYLAAVLMKLFGPSIPLAASIGLLQWSIATAIFVFIFTSGTSKFVGLVAGVVAAIGVPYTITYMTQPFTGNASNIFAASLILLAAFLILKNGGTLYRFMFLGFAIGLGLYLNPQSAIAAAASLSALCFLKTPAWNIRLSVRPSFFLGFFSTLFIGAAPEIWCKLQPLQNVQANHFLKFATPYFMIKNLGCALKCVLAYVDAHPFSRIPDGIYFWYQIPFNLMPPSGFFDYFFLTLGIALLGMIAIGLRTGLRKPNPAFFLFSSLVVFNLIAIVISAKTDNDMLNARRYLTTSAIAFSIWTAYLFTTGMESKYKIIQIASLCFTFLFLGRVTWHYAELLRAPDQLREMRWSLSEIKKTGINRALAEWPYGDILTALTNQQLIVAQWPSRGKIPAYKDMVFGTPRIALVKTNRDKVEPIIDFEGSKYRIDGDVQKSDNFWMAPYQLMK